LTSGTYAQKTVSVKTDQPITDSDVLQKYIEVSALPNGERQKAFSEVSNEMKAKLFKFHLAFQLVKRSNLTKDQKDLILDGILVATPDSYDRTKKEPINKAQTLNLEARAKSLFEGKDGFEIFANLGTETSDIQILKKYQEVTASPNRIERRQTFSFGTPLEKGNTMRTHLVFQMAQRDLSKEQLTFISEAISLASPEMYGSTKGTKLWDETHNLLNDLSDRMLNFFQKEDALEIFISLGGKEGTPIQKNAPLCSCSGASDYCGWWHNGSSCGRASCRYTIGGCGTLLGSDCDGGCQ
jgi:hypothetical protein